MNETVRSRGAIRNEISDLRARIEKLEKELKTAFAEPRDAQPGDFLQDGSVVVERNSTSILVTVPESLAIWCEWTENFESVFLALEDVDGFSPSQWFVPSEEQLQVAFLSKARMHFKRCIHWASGVSTDGHRPHFDFESGSGNSVYVRGLKYAVVRPYRLVHF